LLGVWVLGARRKVIATGMLVVATALTAAAVLPYNKFLTGSPFKFPVDAYFDKYYHPGVNALGFGVDRGLNWGIDPFPGHSYKDAAVYAVLNLHSVNTELFGWATGSLLLAAVAVIAGTLTKADAGMLAMMVALRAAYSLYWFGGGPDFGARYWELLMIPCVALTVRGVEALRKHFDPARVTAAVLALSAMAVILYFPWRAIDKYYHYEFMRPDVRELAASGKFARGLVLIRGERHPDYASAAVYNPLDLHSDAPIYVWDRSPEVRAAVLREYPHRRVWLVDGPSVTGRGFEIRGELRVP